jgi:hypothetical protein
MIADIDIWRAAMAMLKRYGDDAMLEAAARADELMEAGDMASCTAWRTWGQNRTGWERAIRIATRLDLELSGIR